MKLFAVAGKPVFHSLSPELHNHLASIYGKEISYTRLRVENINEIQLFLQAGIFSGLNITAPWKEKSLALADWIDPEASFASAINTLLFEGSRKKAFNTDIDGVENSLVSAGIRVRERSCLVLGAGGAGRAAIRALQRMGGRVTMANRTHERGRVAAEKLGCRQVPWTKLRPALLNNSLLINATPAAQPPFPESWLNAGTTVFDADYRLRPLEAPARKRKCIYLAGDEWLFRQGLAAFSHFHKCAPHGEALQALRTVLKKRKKKRTISLVGFMGCGKSTLAPVLAKQLGYACLDADAILVERTGTCISSFFRRHGERAFRRLEREIAIELSRREHTVIAWGGGVVLDPECRSLLRRNSHVVWLFLPTENFLPRICGGKRPLLGGNPNVETLRKLLEQRNPVYARSADLVLLNDKHPEEVARVIADEIGPYV
ncbi:MAG TPA: hypothetical protein ENN40_05775 [Candidatus Aminicenantes bacterium]|nr:hypothetical protein [Candidatus Aminicenantes bacterium]